MTEKQNSESIRALKTRLRHMEAMVESLRGTILALESAINILTRDLSVAKATIDDLRTHIADLVRQIEKRDTNLA